MKVAFFVNPVAGYGSTKNMKGSDGLTLSSASDSVSIAKAYAFLDNLSDYANSILFYVPSGYMGEDLVRERNYKYIETYVISVPSTRKDTIEFVKGLKGIDVLVFVGGDGTARDVMNSISPDIPVIGVPAGVKMYSSVFAISVKHAANALIRILKDGKIETEVAEVVDINEDDYSHGILNVKQYGTLKVPHFDDIVRNSKAEYDSENEEDAIEYLLERMDDRYYIIGPGTTCKALLKEMGIETNVLGFDIIKDKKLIKEDAGESDIYDITKRESVLIISPVGGQFFLIGRGNKQLSDRVLSNLDENHIIIIASPEKMERMDHLYIDTRTDLWKSGYARVLYGYGKYRLVKVVR